MICSNYGLRIGHATHRGMVRELNEDSYLVLFAPALAPELDALLAVADGMGGHQAGDVASGEVIRILNELFSSSIYQERVGYSLDRGDYYVVVLKEVLEQINERLYSVASRRPELRGMGTTGSVALLVGDQLYVGHVGDSRIYRMRDGELRQLTRDNSWVAEQVEAGALSPEQAAVHPQRNLLTRSLGNNLVLRVERAAFPLQMGDLVLLCTDGLTNVVTDREIAQILSAIPVPQRACDHLVHLANQRGGLDNVTVVAAQLVEGQGSDLSGGRAFGPHGEEVFTQQADTVKILRQPQPADPPAAGGLPGPQSDNPERQIARELMVPLLVALAAVGLSLACGFLGLHALSGPWAAKVPDLAFAIVLFATLLGFAGGYLARAWTEGETGSDDKPGRTAGQIPPDA